MLKKKLDKNFSELLLQPEVPIKKKAGISLETLDLAIPLWKGFYDLECKLNQNIKLVELPAIINCTYNPVEYASELHCSYLSRYLKNEKRVIFVGMNPGPNGMGQTGIPFGNVLTVRDKMGLTGNVYQPSKVHPTRPIRGLSCTIEEPSGTRLWSLFEKLAGGSLDTFAEKCFVHNFCPLIFYDKNGRSITPNELKPIYKKNFSEICLNTLKEQLILLQPEIVIAVGDYVFKTLKFPEFPNIRVLKLKHPSPRSVNNHNWMERAEDWLKDNDIIKYMRNEVD